MKPQICFALCVTALMISMVLWLMSCSNQTTPEPLEMQKPKTYDEQYYANLRAYKKTKHQILYAWFEDYGRGTFKGTSFMRLPDSIDVISLWGGIPKEKEEKEIYDEMRFVQKVKGTKMVGVCFVNMPLKYTRDEAGIKQFGDQILMDIERFGLDGWDFDNENMVEGYFLQGNELKILIEHVGQKIGPKGSDPEKLLIVDGVDFPDDVDPYISYYIFQAYEMKEANSIQVQIDDEFSEFMPPGKLVVTMYMGRDWKTGGDQWFDANGNNMKSVDGGLMYQMEGLARWNPTQGQKGGAGSFIVQRDYSSNPPYKYTRRAIQIMNPAIK